MQFSTNFDRASVLAQLYKTVFSRISTDNQLTVKWFESTFSFYNHYYIQFFFLIRYWTWNHISWKTIRLVILPAIFSSFWKAKLCCRWNKSMFQSSYCFWFKCTQLTSQSIFHTTSTIPKLLRMIRNCRTPNCWSFCSHGWTKRIFPLYYYLKTAYGVLQPSFQ